MNLWVSKCGKVTIESRRRGYHIVKSPDGNFMICDTLKEARAVARALLAPKDP